MKKYVGECHHACDHASRVRKYCGDYLRFGDASRPVRNVRHQYLEWYAGGDLENPGGTHGVVSLEKTWFCLKYDQTALICAATNPGLMMTGDD